jgi:hypothetical protein
VYTTTSGLFGGYPVKCDLVVASVFYLAGGPSGAVIGGLGSAVALEVPGDGANDARGVFGSARTSGGGTMEGILRICVKGLLA